MTDKKGTPNKAPPAYEAADDNTRTERAKANTPTAYEFSDIATLLVLMLRNLDANGDASHGSFDDQLKASMDLLPSNVSFSKSMRVAAFLHGQRTDLFDDLHKAVRALLEEMERTKTDLGEQWSVCAFVSQNQIKRIARL